MPNHELLKAHQFFHEPCNIPPTLKTLHSHLEQHIRSGGKRSRPEIIREWRLMSLSYSALSTKEKHHNLFYQYYVLLDVIADELIDHQWRQSVIDEIYECLEDLSQICPCENNQRHVMSLYKELHITRGYLQV